MDDRKDVEMKFVCPHSWETLEPTSSDDNEDDNEKEVRFCADCSKDVYWCSSEEEMKSHGMQGHCVAFNFARGVDPSHPSDDDFLLTPLNDALTSSDKKISFDDGSEHLNTIDPRDADERRWLYYTDGEEINGPVSRRELESLRHSSPRESCQTREDQGRWKLIHQPLLLLTHVVAWVVKIKENVFGPKKTPYYDHRTVRKKVIIGREETRPDWGWGDLESQTIWVWGEGECNWVDLAYFFYDTINLDDDNYGQGTVGVLADPHGPDYLRRKELAALRKELAALRVVHVNSLGMIGSGVIGFAFGSIALPFLPMLFVIYTAMMGTIVGSAWIVRRYRLMQVQNKIGRENKRRETFHAQMPPLPGSISFSTNSSEIKERVDAINRKRGNQMLIILIGAFGIGCAFMAAGFILMFWIFTLTLLLGTTLPWFKSYREIKKKYPEVNVGSTFAELDDEPVEYADVENFLLEPLDESELDDEFDESEVILLEPPPENGPYVEYYENGQKATEGNYKNGKGHGLWTFWYENGQKSGEVHFKNGNLNGPSTAWYENGQKRMEHHYKNNEIHGLVTLWDENGKKKTESHWKNGKIDGLKTWYYKNGQKEAEVHYKDGEKVSESVWKPDGEPCPITKVVNGSGISVSYHVNGQKESETHWKNGKEDGLWTYWDEKGKKVREILYKDGEEVSGKEF